MPSRASPPRAQTAGAGHVAVLDGHVGDAAGHHRADHHAAVATLHQAMADGNALGVAEGVVLARGPALAGLDGDAVVADREAGTDDLDVFAHLWVEAVGVRGVARRLNGQRGAAEAPASLRMHRPGRRVADGEAQQGDVGAVDKVQTARAEGGVSGLLGPAPQVVAVATAVERAGTRDGELPGDDCVSGAAKQVSGRPSQEPDIRPSLSRAGRVGQPARDRGAANTAPGGE
ncbi:hypothetical protein SAMN04488105_114152 [Salipiger thiooxidans]|uniref:Uncharacterized protein n=1 Tax=Salipiger thiooxidans TaxID=282683 RepID=A0A1G7J9V1_9RHOB|nr:hypothetical protein SAMN04488105_114152 [Salipiger thiooxidans]